MFYKSTSLQVFIVLLFCSRRNSNSVHLYPPLFIAYLPYELLWKSGIPFNYEKNRSNGEKCASFSARNQEKTLVPLFGRH